MSARVVEPRGSGDGAALVRRSPSRPFAEGGPENDPGGRAGGGAGGETALVRALQLASAASPVGSYAWSDGMEYAVHAGNPRDEDSAREWIAGLLSHSVCGLDVPLLAGMHAAWAAGHAEEALRLGAWLLAGRETAELRRADRQQGQALMRVLAGLGVARAAGLRADRRVGYACAFALAGASFGVPARTTAVSFVYARLESMVVTAVKLVPLGQSAGQRMIFDLAGALPSACEAALPIAPADIAAGAPGQAMASARHETQATRLYRS